MITQKPVRALKKAAKLWRIRSILIALGYDRRFVRQPLDYVLGVLPRNEIERVLLIAKRGEM